MSNIEVHYGGEVFTVSGQEIDAVQRLVGDLLASGEPGWLTAYDGHGSRVPYRLLVGPGNPIAIEQIVVNLLLNATEAAGGAPVRVRITSEPVAATSGKPHPWRSLDQMVLIRIADDGPGIPPDRRHAIFEPFTTSKPDGTGIGLALARDAAASLGGHLALEDTERGASFTLVRPLVRSEAMS